jgi:hypothetical protein
MLTEFSLFHHHWGGVPARYESNTGVPAIEMAQAHDGIETEFVKWSAATA